MDTNQNIFNLFYVLENNVIHFNPRSKKCFNCYNYDYFPLFVCSPYVFLTSSLFIISYNDA